MNNRKYPPGEFLFGFIMDILFRFWWFFLPSILLLIVGIFIKPCLYIGAAILLLDVIVSLVDQILIMKTCLEENDNPDFKEFQDALLGGGNWRQNIEEIVSRKISDHQNEVNESTTEEETEKKHPRHTKSVGDLLYCKKARPAACLSLFTTAVPSRRYPLRS